MHRRGKASDGLRKPPAEDARDGVARHPREWSPQQWRALRDCVESAYAHYERRLVDVRQETVERLTDSLVGHGLATPRAAGRRPKGGQRGDQ